MITIDLLNSNAALASLDEAVKQQIVTLSKNDEAAVIASKTGEIAQRIEEDIKASTGIDKLPGEKYYDYLKRAGTQRTQEAQGAADAAALQSQVADLKAKLQAAGAGGGSSAEVARLQGQLADTENRVTELQAQLQQKEADHAKALGTKGAELLEYKYENSFKAAVAGKDRRPGLTESDFNQLLALRMAEARKGKELTEEKLPDGTKVIRFKDSNGMTVNNPADLGNPLTVEAAALSVAGDLFAGDRNATGGGGAPPDTPPGGTGGAGVPFKVTATNRADASSQIETYLAESGVSTKDPNYQAKYNELYDGNGVSQLPIQ
jgi:hypothetical protein